MLLSALWSVLLPACTDAAKPDGPPADSDTQSSDTDPVADTDSAEDTEPPAPAAVDFGGFTPRNVVIFHIDTLRADSFARWGGTRDPFASVTARMPWISIDQAVSTAPWTPPSTASILTGEPPEVHKVRFFDDTGDNYSVAAPTFASHLQAMGLATALVTGSNVLTTPEWRLDQGFAYVGQIDAEPGNAEAVVADAVAWLDTLEPDQPFLLFLQPMDMHAPYRADDRDRGAYVAPDEAFFDVDAGEDAQYRVISAALGAAPTDEERQRLRTMMRDLYEEQALGVARAFNDLMDDLDRRGLTDDTLLVFTADHGETFFDGYFNYVSHSGFPRHEVVHIPLLFGAPGLTPSEVPCLASNMDIFPTVVEAMGYPPVKVTMGASLLGGCREYAFSSRYEASGGVQTLHFLSAESREAQLVYDCVAGTRTAFDLVADPTALSPVSVAEVPGGAALEAALQGHLAEVVAVFPELTCVLGE
jgi:arylsulfatase